MAVGSIRLILVEDLPVKIFSDPRNDPRSGDLPESLLYLCPPGHVPVYLWIGSYPDIAHHNWNSMVEIYNRQIEAQGLPQLKIRSGWVPMVDFPPVEVAVCSKRRFHRERRRTFEAFRLRVRYRIPIFGVSSIPFLLHRRAELSSFDVVDCSKENLRVLSSISNRCVAVLGKGSGTVLFDLDRSQSLQTESDHAIPSSRRRACDLGLPGNPMQYLETDDDVRRFLSTVSKQKVIQTPADDGRFAKLMEPSARHESRAARIDLLLDQFLDIRTTSTTLRPLSKPATAW